MPKKATALTVLEPVEPLLRELRGERVILDSDLARLYGVPTKRLNEQVRRNAERFPPDFCFQLEPQEVANLRSQIATSSYGGRRYLPYAFTEHGAIMAANVLNSPQAVQMSVFVVRAFLKMRAALTDTRQLVSGKEGQVLLKPIIEPALAPAFDSQAGFNCWLRRTGFNRLRLPALRLIPFSRRGPSRHAQPFASSGFCRVVASRRRIRFVATMTASRPTTPTTIRQEELLVSDSPNQVKANT